MDTLETYRETLDEFVARTSRFERYQFAEKSLRFFIYRRMENYALASFVVSLVLPWIDDGLAQTLILGNVWVVAVIGVLHHLSLAMLRPWLLAAAAFEAGVVYALGAWLLDLPYVGTFSVFVFVLRYWMRGEREVNETAYAKFAAAVEAGEKRKLESKK